MPTLTDEAVVLKRLDYSETSQILVLFCRDHGKIRVIAKGIKRSTKTRFAAGIDLLEIGRVAASYREDHGDRLATLTEWKQSRMLSGLREKLSRIRAAEYVAEITAKLTADWDPHVELYGALVATLDVVAEATEPLVGVIHFQQRLLNEVGLAPRFDRCVCCGRCEELTYFSSQDGGIVCRHCEGRLIEKQMVGPKTLAVLRCGPTTGALKSTFTLLNYHISYVTGGESLLAPKLVPPSQGRIIE